MGYKGSSKYHGPSRDLVVSETGNGNDYTTDEDDQLVLADTNDSTLTVTLATAQLRAGATVTVLDEGANAATNNITVSAEGGEDINGSDQDLTISTNRNGIRFQSDGDQWLATSVTSA